MTERVLAIGDVHGCADALIALLARFDPRPRDTVVLLGDIINRGPQTAQVIDTLLALQQRTHVILIRGNHEERYLAAAESSANYRLWMGMGGAATLKSYGTEIASGAKRLPAAHHRFLLDARDFHETATDIFVHAGVDPLIPLETQSPRALRWDKFQRKKPPHVSGKRVICGHTQQRSGLPLAIPGHLCIDTWAYGDGWLTGLETGTNVIHQTRQHDGSHRVFQLDQPPK